MTELLRALGVLCEPPAAEHRHLAAAAGLGDAPSASDHADVFAFDLYPYASVYLGGEGKLGGEARDRVAGFWRALGLVPPAEPDHLSALLGLYAGLADAGAPAQWRRALLWEHLLSWTPPYLAKMEDVAGPFHRRWARLLGAALAAEAAALGTLRDAPLAHREAPRLDPPGLVGGAAFVDQLLAPARTGFVLVRADLAAAGRELGLGLRLAERRYVLGALMAQDARATLQWLAEHASSWAARHEWDFWACRAAAASRLLAEAAEAAADAEVQRAVPG
jgi:Nitrate reductase delta subunit